MDPLQQYGVALGGAFITISVLSVVVRVLWKQTLAEIQARIADLTTQFRERLSDKNAELTQVWAQLRSTQEEVKVERAEKEWLQRLLDRQTDLTRAALDELKARREPGKAS